MDRASEQRIYIWHIDWKGKKMSPATILLRTVWGIHYTHPFHTWGYVKWQGKKVPVELRGAKIWDSFDIATNTDWKGVPGEANLAL